MRIDSPVQNSTLHGTAPCGVRQPLHGKYGGERADHAAYDPQGQGEQIEHDRCVQHIRANKAFYKLQLCSD